MGGWVSREGGGGKGGGYSKTACGSEQRKTGKGSRETRNTMILNKGKQVKACIKAALSGAPPAGLKPTITIPGTNPIIQFVFPVGDLVFRTWQIGSGDGCEVIFFAMYVNNSPVLAYVHDDNKDADQTDLQRVADTLAQVQQAGCTPLTAS
ncbi:hypothetical protein PoB_006765300 [Plakobranchus ocellatus]|uniref:Uncharacterized protein n=1 Tax=Plakobranchus ocellatus TaxID=259542 RepID=A0AAV4DAB2_9GAST|nr:hypothetical protein PoB_006765300 [Plakobranchus ocellatus]